MAKSGRRPPGDLRNTLGSLVASALEQVSVVREVVERGAQAQRSRYDSIRLDRRRREALASLGEVVYRLAVRGRLGPLADDPEVRAQLEEIDGIDQRRETADEGGVSSFAANSGWSRSQPRRRHRSDDQGETRVWRPVPPFAAPDPDDELDDAPDELAAGRPEPEPAPPAFKGGIRFGDDWDDDDDLDEYMCDDDVPPRAEPEPEPEPAPTAEAAPPKRRKRKPRKPKPKPAPEPSEE